MDGFGTSFSFLGSPRALVWRLWETSVNRGKTHQTISVSSLRVLRARPFLLFSSIQDGPNLDFGKQAVLEHPDLLHADEFQQGQERDRNLGPTRRVLEKIEKRDRSLSSHSAHDKLDFVRDGVAFLENLTKVFPLLFDLFEHFLEGINQIENPDFRFKQRARIFERRFFRYPDDQPFLQQLPVMKLECRVLELFILDQLPDQIPARIFFFGLFIRGLLVDRKEISALDVDQIRRHHDKLSGNLKVQHPKCFQILEVMAGNPFDRNIVNIDLILPDQVEQEIERPFEDFQLHLVIILHQSEIRNATISRSGLTFFGLRRLRKLSSAL